MLLLYFNCVCVSGHVLVSIPISSDPAAFVSGSFKAHLHLFPSTCVLLVNKSREAKWERAAYMNNPEKEKKSKL